MATTFLRRRIVEDFTHDQGLKLGLVLGQIGFVFADVIVKLQTVFAGAAKDPRSAASATVLDRRWSPD